MAEIKAWVGIQMWQCDHCVYRTGYGTVINLAATIVHHIEQKHPDLEGNLPYATNGHFLTAKHEYDLTPASDG